MFEGEKMTSLPYMQLYVSDYLADTAHLTAQQHGAYMLLLMNYWQRGKPLDNTNERLSHVARLTPEEWEQAKPTLEEFFVIDGHLWTHARVEDDLEKIREKSVKASFAGRRSVVARGLNERSTNAEHPLNHKEEDKEEEEDKDIDKKDYAKLFDQFWEVYPLKMGKAKAFLSFKKVLRTIDFEIVLKGAQRYKSDPNREQAYTLYPTTWLNGHRWLDEPLPTITSPQQNKREKELQQAKEKAEREKAEAAKWFKEQEERQKSAVPPPAELRELMRKNFTK
jgi:uncharacterized protein YdaU (DUF1376 family)